MKIVLGLGMSYFGLGGAAKVCQELIQGLAQRGHSCAVVSAEDRHDMAVKGFQPGKAPGVANLPAGPQRLAVLRLAAAHCEVGTWIGTAAAPPVASRVVVGRLVLTRDARMQANHEPGRGASHCDMSRHTIGCHHSAVAHRGCRGDEVPRSQIDLTLLDSHTRLPILRALLYGGPIKEGECDGAR